MTVNGEWIKKVPIHDCGLPFLDDDAGAGSVWRCSGCRKVWIVERSVFGRKWMVASKLVTEQANAQDSMGNTYS